ncbi:FAR1-related sequence 5-like protein [Tanacetum coccineum]
MLPTKCYMIDKVFSLVVDVMFTLITYLDQFSLAHSGHPGSGTTKGCTKDDATFVLDLSKPRSRLQSRLEESSNIKRYTFVTLIIKNFLKEHQVCFMDPSHSSALSSISQNSVSFDVVDVSCVSSGSSLIAFTQEIVAYEKESNETHAFKIKGNVYESVDDCVVAYIKYAAEAGFVVRRSCQKRLRNGDVKQKYLVCNRKARTVFNLDPRTRKFVLNMFDTIHNHELEHEEFKHLSKRERKLTYLEQAFIVKAASVNIGAKRAHHLLTGIKGSYLLVHVSKYNYREFGDVVSFDVTFKTNKYKMVFVPFTAIDNHRKCVTVAAGLLKNETTKSYIWLLKAFGKAPSIVVTDQDGATRNAIEAEFGGSKHRLCRWHITQKLPAKIYAKIYDETDFKEKLNKIVWNMYIGPKEFEYKWGKLMEEFKLENHKWLTKMFNIRFLHILLTLHYVD